MSEFASDVGYDGIIVETLKNTQNLDSNTLQGNEIVDNKTKTEWMSIAKHLVDMSSMPNLYDPPDSIECEQHHNKKRKFVPVGTQVLTIQNQIKLARRIFYLEFRMKLLNTIAELAIPMNYAVQLINCLDRYIPDQCTCCEDDLREWILNIRLTPYEKVVVSVV
jgi:hypothetical protein